MQARRLSVGMKLNLEDFFCWRSCIADEDEQKAFDQIVVCHFLWGKGGVSSLKQNLNQADGSPPELRPETSTPLQDLQKI